MADIWQRHSTQTASGAQAKPIDGCLRIYMLKVYYYMSLGLLFTALAAYFVVSSWIYQQIH